MRILDRYETRQLVPVWVWCLVVFLFLSILIDLFEHLDEILRYAIPPGTVAQYYVSFLPLIFVRACPLALLLSTAFVATRMVRYQELLAMNAGGQSRLRASVPFLFVGWLVSVMVFGVNDRIVPPSAATYQRLRDEVFRGTKTKDERLEKNVATMDDANRLYHARVYDSIKRECQGLTIIEQDALNRPRKTISARRAILTDNGWELYQGTISRTDADGTVSESPEGFEYRRMQFPVTAAAFAQPDTELEALSFRQLRLLIDRLRTIGITNTRRYVVELAAKVTLPLMNLIVCFIGFVAATKPTSRGRLQELGVSLGWGIIYYIGVATSMGMGKQGLLPVMVAVWAPHILAVALCVRAVWNRD